MHRNEVDIIIRYTTVYEMFPVSRYLHVGLIERVNHVPASDNHCMVTRL